MLKTMNKKITLVVLMMLTAVTSLVLFVSPAYAYTGVSASIIDNDNQTEWYASSSLDINFNSYPGYFMLVDGVKYDNLDGRLFEIELSNGAEAIIRDNNEQTEWRATSSISVNFNSYPGYNMLVDGVKYDNLDGRLFEIEFYVANMEPVISGQTTFAVDVDEGRDLSYFMQWIKAYDETDGDITSSIVVETDNYTPNKAVLGTHTVTIAVSDSSGNKTTAVINIHVADVTKPVITGSTATAQIGYKETWNIANFKSTLTVTDNYDTLSHSNITVKTDGYTSNKTKLGTYNVVYAVSDSSGNEGTFTKPVKVIDNVKPVFDGPLTISTSNTTIMTESDVRARLTASDEIDGNLTAKITLVEDNYSGKGNKVGSYTIKYSVTDNAGNIAEHTVTINRIDSVPPTIWVENGKTIRVPQGTTISRQQIIDILEATKVIQVNAMTTFTFPVDEYLGNEETPGVYLMSILSRSTNGNEDIHNVTIQVLADSETPDTDDVITKGDDKTWIQKNGLYVGIGAVALIGLVVLFLNRKRK